MHPHPHQYAVKIHAEPTGDVPLVAPNLPGLVTAPPAEFDGPGDCRVVGTSKFTVIVS